MVVLVKVKLPTDVVVPPKVNTVFPNVVLELDKKLLGKEVETELIVTFVNVDELFNTTLPVPETGFSPIVPALSNKTYPDVPFVIVDALITIFCPLGGINVALRIADGLAGLVGLVPAGNVVRLTFVLVEDQTSSI